MATKIPDRTPHDRQMFGHLRETRAATQWLQGFSAESRKRAAGLDASVRVASLTEAFSAAVQKRVDDVITPQLDAIRKMFVEDVNEYEWCGDSVTTIRLTWARVKELWPAATMQSDVIEQKLGEMDLQLDRIVYQCTSLTLSPRVNDVLGNLRIGQVLDLDFAFGPEMPSDPELRKTLLLELAQQCGVLEAGVVDVEQRVIYKVSTSRRQQLRSAWKLAAWLLGGAIVFPLALALFKGSTITIPLLRTLLLDYALIFAGSGAHLAVAAIRSQKAETRPSFQALNDWFLWLHVREKKVFWGFAYIWIGYVLLAATIGIDKLQWQSAFFAGYSIDSIVELLLGRFEATVKTKTEAVISAVKAVAPT